MNNENSEVVFNACVNIVSAYVQRHPMSAQQIGVFMRDLYDSIDDLRRFADPNHRSSLIPAVPVEDSIHDEYIICLEDGKKLKLLKRYLRVRHQMTPEDYRKRWGLPPNYPMVAPKYSKVRSSLARNNELGRRRAYTKREA